MPFEVALPFFLNTTYVYKFFFFINFQSLKFWRFRMYLLPKENRAMNKIIENGSQYCDVFTDNAADNTKQQIDDFMRFVELHLNKLKRRKARVSIY